MRALAACLRRGRLCQNECRLVKQRTHLELISGLTGHCISPALHDCHQVSVSLYEGTGGLPEAGAAVPERVPTCEAADSLRARLGSHWTLHQPGSAWPSPGECEPL
ncbi:uncharacterized protein LOC126108898 isoform X1 [Schistocerca cancellata]|uniref:uncharacterized protein LOC126108898 isoform X1 n=1 Tax=Schistocerca cancellata TaxID=274614 RepID=UPI0021185564|nr:uncharacterized protein LOC126108898 isoform X1 [Schistocerca cancellata]